MLSEKQLVANRQNALKSTGPQTEEGKGVVSKNAIRHGILSKAIHFDESEKVELDEFRSDFYEHFQPCGGYESILVDRIVSCAWRIGRIVRIETQMFLAEKAYLSFHNVFKGSSKENMAVLSRYEAALEKGLYRASNELIKLQEKRKAILVDDCLEILPSRDCENFKDKNGFV